MLKHRIAVLLALFIGIHVCGITEAGVPAESTRTALAAIEDAKSLAEAGRGELLLVGSALSTEQSPSENVVVVLEYPNVSEMRPGMILMLAITHCDPIDKCLIARRVTEIGAKGDLQTEPYSAEELLLTQVNATLLGSVSYAIDLESRTIRDMRPERLQESVTLAQAIAGERTRAHAAAAPAGPAGGM